MSQDTIDTHENYKTFVGNTRLIADEITDELCRRFRATFLSDQPPAEKPGEAPMAIHWCLGADAVGRSHLGMDGHPHKGDFLPPTALPRRMWAGGTLTFQDTLLVGDRVTRTSEIVGAEPKAGKSGHLLFVTVSHRLETERGLAIEERQDIVYRDPPLKTLEGVGSRRSLEPRRAAHWSREETIDSVMLFRYSALTFNAHRIHYDLPYATGVEGYEGLVVHGPLQATLLLRYAEHLRGVRPKRFQFRGIRALTSDRLTMEASDNGGGLDLRIIGPDGAETTTANAHW